MTTDPGADRCRPDGDVEALHAEHSPAVYAWACLRVTGRLRAFVAPEDVAQEIWVRAMRAAPARDRTAPARAWLFPICKHVLYEVQRAANRDRSAGAGGSTTRLLALADVPADVTSLTQRLARDDALQGFLARATALDDDERMLLIHIGLESMPHAEVAARFGIGVDALQKRWQRLRDRVREWPSAAQLLP
jgi:RNA polymerase sigma factor (sigma-70 family)